MSEQSHKTLRAILLLAGVALIVWYLSGMKHGSTITTITKDTVIAQNITIYQPTETRIIYHDTIIERVDTFTTLADCQNKYELLWKDQMGLLKEYHAERSYDTTISDTNYIIKSSIRIQDNKLLSYHLQPTIINTTTEKNNYRYSLYGGLYVNNVMSQNSYGAMLTIPVRDLQFSVGKSFSDRGWFGSVSTRILSK